MRLRVGLSTVRRAGLAAAVTIGALGASAAAPSGVAALSCGAGVVDWTGTHEEHAGTRGASAQIEYVNEALCTTTGGNAFSSYWASVIGVSNSDVNGWNIFQVGIDKCRNGDCVLAAPQNTPYFEPYWV